METIKIQFRTKNPKQILAAQAWLDDSVAEIVYGGSKGGGKSYLGASLIFGDAMLYPETQYFIARKELNDLRKFTIPTIYEVFKNWGLDIKDYATFNGQDNFFRLKNGSKVFLISCADVPGDPLFERFGSMQMTRGWIEEAGEVAESAKANLYLSIGRWKNMEYGLKKKLLITCNPKKGWLKRNYIDPFRDGVLEPDKRYIQAFATDNRHLPPDYVQTLASEKDPVRRARLFEGDWDYDDDATALLTDTDISRIFTNEGNPGLRYMTVDPAFGGKDEAVIYIWNGYIVEYAYSIPKTDPKTFKSTVDWYMQVHSLEIKRSISDATGNGAYLPSFIPGMRGFIGASSPLQDKRAKVQEMIKPFFVNLRSQCIWEFAQRIKEGKVAFKINNEDMRKKLIEELEQWKTISPDNDKKVAIISKEDMKEALGGRSTDYSDALYMREFFELDEDSKNSATAETIKKQEQANKDIPFDPMGI